MPLSTDEGVLDPSHAENTPETVVAGRPAPEPVTPTREFKITEDENQVETGGKKYVREEALHEAREANRKMSETLSRLNPLMPEFEEFLAQKAGRQSATVHRATETDNGEYSADELEGLAIVRGYYDAENKPDTRRAKAELDLMSRIAGRQAERVVKPVAENTVRDRAAANYSQALGRKFVDGEPIADEKYVRAAFDSLPEEYRADPLIANITSVIAAGLQALDDRKEGRSRGRGRGRGGEPVLREGSSGRVDRVSEALDDFDRAAARARGKSPEQWAKLQKGVGDSYGTVLEDV